MSRVGASVNAKTGELKLHLKANYVVNTLGEWWSVVSYVCVCRKEAVCPCVCMCAKQCSNMRYHLLHICSYTLPISHTHIQNFLILVALHTLFIL